MPAPFHTRYSDEAYLQNSSIKPSTGFVTAPKPNLNGVRGVKVTKKATGASMQAAGAGMQAAGKGMKAVGKNTTKAGARLSSTGVGAIVGVPLMAVGGVAAGTGAGMQVAGKQVSRSGRRMQKSASSKKRLSLKGGVGSISIHIRALMAGFMFMLPISFLTLFEMGFFVAAAAVQSLGAAVEGVLEADNVVSKTAGFVVGVFGWFAGTALDAIKGATGIDIGAIAGSLDPGNLFVAFWAIAISYGWITLLVVWGIYQFSGLEPLSGKGEGAKKAALLVALCMYSLPMAHMFPWFIVWIWTIKTYE